jgi:hypothetical protein
MILKRRSDFIILISIGKNYFNSQSSLIHLKNSTKARVISPYSKTILHLNILKVNNVSNVIIIQKVNTNSSVGRHRPPTNAKVVSGAM